MSPTSTSQPPDASSEPHAPRRRRRWLWLLAPIVALLGVLAAAIVYVQTPSGFSRIVVPLLAKALDGQLLVHDGSMTLGGRVEARGVVYADTEIGLSIEVGRLHGTLVIESLLPGRPTHIVDVVAEDGALTWRPPSSDAEGSPEENDGTGTVPLPVIIEKAQLQRVHLEYADAQRRVRVGPAEVSGGDIEPGGNGWATLDGPIVIETVGEESSYVGRGSLRVDSAIRANGDIEWASASTKTTLERTGDGASPVSYSGDIRAVLQSQWSASVEIAAESAGASLGQLQMKFLPAGTRGWQASAQFADVTSSYLDTFLTLGEGTLVSGVLRGTANVVHSEEGYDVSTDLTAKGFRLRSARSVTTPPADLTIKQAGAWRGAAHQLRLDHLDVAWSRGGRSVLAIGLDRPATIDVSGTASEIAAGAVAQLTARVTDLNAAEMHQWVAFLGIERETLLDRGTIGGTIVGRLGGAPEPVVIEAKLAGKGVHLDAARIGREIGSADVRVEFAGGFRDGGRVRVGRLDFEARPRVGRVSLGIAGSADWRVPTSDLRGNLNVADSGAVLKWLWPEGSALPKAGATSGTCTLAIAKGGRVRIGATVDVARVAYSNAAGTEEQRDVSAKVDAELDIEGRALTLNRSDFDVRAGGKAVGAFSALGRIPWGRGAKEPARFTVKTQNFDSAPWLRLAGVPLGKGAGTLPLSGEVDIEFKRGTSQIDLKGRQTISLAAPAADGGPFDATVEGQFVVAEGQSRLDVALRAPRSNGANDIVEVKAQLDAIAASPGRWNLGSEAKVTHLDLARYQPLWTGPELGSQTRTSGTVSRVAPTQPSYPVDGGINIQFVTLAYRQMRMENGVAKVQLSSQRIGVDISSASTLGGRVQGQIQREISGGVVIDARGSSLDVGNFDRSLWPNSNRTTSGKLDATINLSAAPAPGQDWRDVAKGRLTGNLRNSQLAGLGILNFMAKETGVSEIGQLVLNGADADLTVDRGIATIANLKATGPAIHLAATGQFTLRGDVAVEVQPFLGPEMFQRVSFNNALLRPVGALIRTATGLLGLPFVVKVSGSIDNPKYGLRARAPSLIEDTAKGIFGAGERGLETGSNFLRGLFGTQ